MHSASLRHLHALTGRAVFATASCFLGVCGILYACNFFVHFYHDDFAYASLSYAYDVGGKFDERLSFFNLLRFLIHHYVGWGGRTNAFALAVPLMHLGPGVFYFVQTIITTLIVILQAKILCLLTKNTIRNFLLSVTLILCCYMLIPLSVSRDGIFWATASALYVWPMLFLTLAMYLLYIKKYTKLTIFLFFLAASCNETYSVITLTYLLGLIALRKNKIKEYSYYFISAFCGFLFICLSPGNIRRMSIQKVGTANFFNDFFLGLSVLGQFSQHLEYSYFFLASLFLALLFYAYKIIVAKNKEFLNVLPFLLPIATIVVFYAFPVCRSYRVLVPYYLFVPFIIVPFYTSLFARYKYTLAVLAFIAGFAVNNYSDEIGGYAANYSIAIENDRILRHSQNEDEIRLKKFPCDRHRNDMPYDGGAYIQRFMITYYDLKKEVKLIYK